jgi:site-specific DNA-methyltransferase (adenine-specific)
MNAVHIVVAMKPIEGNFSDNALELGVAGVNIDACRVETQDTYHYKNGAGGNGFHGGVGREPDGSRNDTPKMNENGRWPANVIHDGSEEVVAEFPDAKGGTWNSTEGARHFNNDGKTTNYETSRKDNSEGSAARFFKECSA